MLGVFLVLLLLVSSWVIVNWRYVAAFPSILPSFYAKEFCSCRYVMERPLEACHDYARQWLPISGFRIDEARKRVEVEALGVTRAARHISGREGCRLEP